MGFECLMSDYVTISKNCIWLSGSAASFAALSAISFLSMFVWPGIQMKVMFMSLCFNFMVSSCMHLVLSVGLIVLSRLLSVLKYSVSITLLVNFFCNFLMNSIVLSTAIYYSVEYIMSIRLTV